MRTGPAVAALVLLVNVAVLGALAVDYRPVIELGEYPQLSADVDDLAVALEGEVVDQVAYDRATESEFWYWT